MQVRRLTAGLSPQRSPSRSPAREELSSDAITTGTQSDVKVHVDLPIRPGEEPQMARVDNEPTDAEPIVFEVSDEKDQLTEAIQLSIEVNQRARVIR